jgi:uncharacterized protein (DUF2342 family)
MGLFRSAQVVAGASGDGPIDWTAVGDAARAGTDPGNLEISDRQRRGYAEDVGEACDRVRRVGEVSFDLPDRVEIQHRHHWIDANVDTFRRILLPLEARVSLAPGAARVANTGSMTVALSFLARNVLGQFDPLLLADGEDHALYFVHPNIVRVADLLSVDRERFRRWIAFHEVAHAAEFGAAPWLAGYLEEEVTTAVAALAQGRIDRESLGRLDVTMTAVEGYAELLMDRAFDGSAADLRERLEERRRGRGPVAKLIRRLLGLGMKRRQYERGKRFFEAVAAERGVAGAGAVWADPAYLPTEVELEEPDRWLARVDP